MMLFFLINELYFLISAVTAQLLNPAAELVIPTGTPNNEANAETETHPLGVEMERRKCSE